MTNKPGLGMIVSGPSGVGKDTILDAWMRRDPNVVRVIAYTTREPRPGEQDGVDYHFVSTTEFQDLIIQNAFLEYKEVHGNYYGTPRFHLQELLDSGKTAILKIDVQGALQVMQIRPDIVTVFLVAPSWEVLVERLTRRGTESGPKLEERLRTALFELEHSDHYQHVIINENIEDCVSQLERIRDEACGISSSA